jgi:hypothetical protein
MTIEWKFFTTIFLLLIYFFYDGVIKPKQQEKKMPQLPTDSQDDDYCRIALAINKSVSEEEVTACWKAIDNFYKKYKSIVDTQQLLSMCEQRELILTA